MELENFPNYPMPYFKTGNVPIVLSFSDYFVPYAAVEIHSILAHGSAQNNYDFLVLHTSISERSRERLLQLVSDFSNAAIRFINVSGEVSRFPLLRNGHVGIETFYRLICTEILRNYEKVVYLDSDLIILKDLKEMYDLELGGALLGAAIDPDHAGEYNGGLPGVRKYTDEVLKLRFPFSYFQAGVLLINVQAMNRKFGNGYLLKTASEREYMYVDQDVLNMCCEGNTLQLDMRWNVMADCMGVRKDKLIRRAPSPIYEAYLEARRDPFIIHYAGTEKPWETPDSDFAEYFWEHARKTGFYELIIKRMAEASLEKKKGFLHQVRLYRLACRLLPEGTRRRRLAKKVYSFLSHQ